jgi:RND family efflux transporter MFP subunit
LIDDPYLSLGQHSMKLVPPAQRGGLGLFSALGAALMLTASAGAAELSERGASDAFDCIIEPWQTVKLSSAVAGVIREVTVDRGDFVKKGQVVARLEAGVEEAALALAKAKATSDQPIKSALAKLDYLRNKYDRSAALIDRKIVSGNQYDEDLANAKVGEQDVFTAELNQKIAALEVDHAEAVVEQRILRSPVDGVVAEILLHPGEYRNDQSPILTVTQIDPLRVEAYVPTTYYRQVENASVASVEPEEPFGGTYQAKVRIVDRVMDAASGTFGVRLELPSPDHRLPAGLKCKIRFPNVTRPIDQAAERSWANPYLAGAEQ